MIEEFRRKYPLDKTALSVFKLGEEPNESAFWLSKTPAERWEMVEYLRRLYYGDDYPTRRLQRSFEITERPSR